MPERLPVRFSASLAPIRKAGVSCLLFFVFFLAGSTVGTFVALRSGGGFFELCRLSSDEHSFINYLLGLWTLSWPSLLAVFLASSVVGFLLLPCLFLLRGYMISASVGALLASAACSWYRAALIVGLPSLFSTAALFLLCDEAFSSSYVLYRTCMGTPRLRYSFLSADRVAVSAVLLTTAAVIQQFLIPLFL